MEYTRESGRGRLLVRVPPPPLSPWSTMRVLPPPPPLVYNTLPSRRILLTLQYGATVTMGIYCMVCVFVNRRET